MNYYVYRYGRSYGGMFNVSNITENAIKNGQYDLQTFVAGEITEPSTSLNAKMANTVADMGRLGQWISYWGWHNGQSLDGGPVPMGRAYLSSADALTCDDLGQTNKNNGMLIPSCEKATQVGQACNQASVPFFCTQNMDRDCPHNYSPFPVTCGKNHVVCKRNLTPTEENSDNELYNCCSGIKKGAINCSSDYCVAAAGATNGNTETKCHSFLPKYCKQLAAGYPKVKNSAGKYSVMQDKATWLNNVTPATDRTNVTFLSDEYPGCGCNDDDYVNFTKKKYVLVKYNTKGGGGEIDISADVTLKCWFGPCATAASKDYTGAPNCTYSACVAVQDNAITGAGDKKLVNTCTASAKTNVNKTKNNSANSADANTSLANSIASLAAAETVHPKNTNLYIYIGIGAGVFVLLVILVMLFRK